MSQPPRSRLPFRLPSIARSAPEPVPTPTPAPETAPPAPPVPVITRPVTRPATQPTLPASQPQEPPQPSQKQSPTPPGQISPPKPAAGGVASVPSPPAQRPPAPIVSLPTSPVQTATVTGPVTAPAPVQSPPKPRFPTPTSSPVSKPAQTSPKPTSPVTKPMPTTVSVPTSPVPRPAPVTSSVRTSPDDKARTAPIAPSMPTFPPDRTIMSVTTARAPSPPRTTYPVAPSPYRSPKLGSTAAPPPSPLILPPAQVRSDAETDTKIPLVPEQKAVLVQNTVDKPTVNQPKSWFSDVGDAIKSSIEHQWKQQTSKDHGETREKTHHEKILSDSEERGTRVITIAGENRGAFMEVIRSPNRKHVYESNTLNGHKKQAEHGDKWKSFSGSDEEGKPKTKNNGLNTLPMSAFMNSNVQSVNNSIVYNSSYSHHDPGVHLALSRRSSGGGFHIKDRSNGHYDS